MSGVAGCPRGGGLTGRAGTGPVFFKVLFKPSRNISLLAGDALMVENECCGKEKNCQFQISK